MTIFQAISLLPAVIGYILLSIAAWKNRHDRFSIFPVFWTLLTGLLAVLLPIIAFSIK